ncbi:MAG TPA: PilZ domain-containing protein [Thermoanaerobaculaceae bacterium]|nr:PilZ domain-containing protein [Thermoanaerobaculaceae bacterium]HRS15154.1 PilZ domain-containing protein [Thermoanaerobaculaceae bacterium]
MNERRAVPRVEVPQPVPAKVKAALPARVLDISSHGAQLEVTTSLRPLTSCDLRIALPDGEVTIRSVVRRCKAWGFGLDEKEQRVLLYRAGVEFSDVPPEVLARLSTAFFYQNPPPLPEEPVEAEEEFELQILTGDDGEPRRAPVNGPVKIKFDTGVFNAMMREAERRIAPELPSGDPQAEATDPLVVVDEG